MAARIMKTMVRCLGPRKGEHYFLSSGPYNRICPKCAAMVASIRMSATLDRVCKVLLDGNSHGAVEGSNG